MATLNQYNLYAYNMNAMNFPQKDEVDKHIDFFKTCDDFSEVRDYVLEHFGEIDNEKWVDFAEYHKECYLKFNDECIEFCSLRNHKQYYGKGWLKLN